jgi:hypothetical protein
MAGRFLSTRNDFKLVLIYFVVILLFCVCIEAYFFKTGNIQIGDPIPPKPQYPPPDTPIVVVNETVDVLSVPGTTNEGQTSTEGFTLDYDYVYQISVSLTWTDDYGNNDRFRVTLYLEGNALGSAEGDSGAASFTVTDNEEPVLNGTFSLEIEAVDCPGRAGGAIPVDLDSGNTWELFVDARVGTIEGGAR